MFHLVIEPTIYLTRLSFVEYALSYWYFVHQFIFHATDK